MKKIMMVFFLFIFHQTTFAEMFDCNSTKPFAFNASGYLVGDPTKSLTKKEEKEDHAILRKIFEIVIPDPDQPSTYLKAFDIGIYRFVKNHESNSASKWDIYRKNPKTEKWELQKSPPNPIKVFKDQAIFVNVFGRDTLKILDTRTLSTPKKELEISTEKEKIKVVETTHIRPKKEDPSYVTGQKKTLNFIIGTCLNKREKRHTPEKAEQKVRS